MLDQARPSVNFSSLTKFDLLNSTVETEAAGSASKFSPGAGVA
jgi:hypothetical protein